jgi:hypothetical protein
LPASRESTCVISLLHFHVAPDAGGASLRQR